ncbi:hypothetical protein [Leptolyngbya phage Lbo-JY46]
MTASQIKTNGWLNLTKPFHKKQQREYYELRGSEVNKCFGKVQSYNPKNGEGYTVIRAMISTEDPFVSTIPYTKDFKVINKVWERLMNQLLEKIFDVNL